MEPQLPKPDYVMEEWKWPWTKFSLDPEILFTTLHTRFNLRPLPIQDSEAFYRDVCECIEVSNTIDEFYSKLEERKIQREKEIDSAWEDVSSTIGAAPWILGCERCYDPQHPEREMSPDSKNDSTAQRCSAFSSFYRTMSLDSLVNFFDGYTRDRRKRRKEGRRRLDELLERIRNKKRKDHHSDSVSASTTVKQASSSSAHLLSLEPIQALPSVTSTIHDEPGAQDPSHGMSTLETPATSRTHTNQSQPISSSSQPGPQTAESSPLRKRKRVSGEDNDEEAHISKWKKQRVISDGVENNADSLAASQHESDVTGAVSIAAPKRPGKRRMEDTLQSTESLEPISKRARTDNGPNNYTGYPRDLTPVFTQAPLKSDAGASELTTLNNTQAEHSASKPKRKSRVSRRRVGKRDETPLREEQSTPQKQSRQKRGGQGQQKRKSSPPIERLLRSKRSSRRDPGHELFYLGDDATACSVANTR
ncbi:hypothetical protein ACHAQJ_008308 [Trichoderma viride]